MASVTSSPGPPAWIVGIAVALAVAVLVTLPPAANAVGAHGPLTALKLDRMPLEESSLINGTLNKVCTGEGESFTCIADVGNFSVDETDWVGVTDTRTGARGTFAVRCQTVIVGTTTSFQNAPGTTVARGETACVVDIVMRDGRMAIGVHRVRHVIENGSRRIISSIDVVRSNDRAWMDLSFGTVIDEGSAPWPEPAPLSQDSAKRLDAGGNPGSPRTRTADGTEPATIAFKQRRRMPGWFASIGSIVPSNRSFPVRVVTIPGARCTGAITGRTTIPLPPAIANAKGVASMGAIAAGTLTAGARWTAKVTCTRRDGARHAVVRTTFTTHEIPS